MFRPVGSQPPSVYWRRRLVFVASLIVLLVLIVLTVRVLLSNDPAGPNAAGPTGSTRSSSSSPAQHSSSTPRSTASRTPSTDTTSSGTPSTTGSSSTSKSGSPSTSSSTPPPKPCTSGSLGLATDTDKTSYGMTDKPTVSLLVTNKSTSPCVQNLGDTQIVMRVYNGESRVWGSHDCKIDKTPNERTLAAGSTVRLNITWTGYSSMPNNCNNRQHVSAGTYTLYASLSGKEAAASQFTITP